MGKYGFLFLVFVSVYSSYVIYNIFRDAEIPTLEEQYWGPKAKKGDKEDTSIRPFSININDNILYDLKSRLKLELLANASRLTKPMEGVAFEYGFNTEYLKKVGDHWLNKYDWRAREKMLNKYPQFKTNIQGIDIHFQHVKSSNNGKYKKTRPLLLLHGWPGSFVEFQKVISDLIDPKNSDINFELVIPSLPGYGFSEAAHRPGLGALEMAQLFKNLMVRIGHKKFYAHGGDWGSLISSNMATLYHENVMGIHLSICASMHSRTTLKILIGSLAPEYFFSKQEQASLVPLSNVFKFMNREFGYMHIQATKPDTVGVGLSNSPLGLAAYILEKFSTWTNKEWISKSDGGLSTWKMDDLLDNLMVYWVTNSITTSVRLYSETFNIKQMSYGIDNVPTYVPTGCLSSPNELMNLGEWLVSDKYPQLVHFTEADKGGHFAGFEQPEIFLKDIVTFFKLLESSGLALYDDNIKMKADKDKKEKKK